MGGTKWQALERTGRRDGRAEEIGHQNPSLLCLILTRQRTRSVKITPPLVLLACSHLCSESDDSSV